MFENSEVTVGVFQGFRGFSEHCEGFSPTNLQVLWCGCEAELMPVSGDVLNISSTAAFSVTGLNPSDQAENILLLIVYQPPAGTSGRMMHPKRGASSSSG